MSFLLLLVCQSHMRKKKILLIYASKQWNYKFKRRLPAHRLPQQWSCLHGSLTADDDQPDTPAEATNGAGRSRAVPQKRLGIYPAWLSVHGNSGLWTWVSIHVSCCRRRH